MERLKWLLKKRTHDDLEIEQLFSEERRLTIDALRLDLKISRAEAKLNREIYRRHGEREYAR